MRIQLLAAGMIAGRCLRAVLKFVVLLPAGPWRLVRAAAHPGNNPEQPVLFILSIVGLVMTIFLPMPSPTGANTPVPMWVPALCGFIALQMIAAFFYSPIAEKWQATVKEAEERVNLQDEKRAANEVLLRPSEEPEVLLRVVKG